MENLTKEQRERAITRLVNMEIENSKTRDMFYWLYNGVEAWKKLTDEEIIEMYEEREMGKIE